MVTPLFGRAPGDDLIVRTKVGAPASVSVVITNNYSRPVEITGVTHTFGDRAKVTLETLDPGKKYRLTLLTNAPEAETWNARVMLHLEGGPIPRFALPAVVEVRE
ncbi:MAG: hypothetical protein V1816_21455 [Pseudomonadota bacterium]